MKSIIINFSGHPLSEEARTIFENQHDLFIECDYFLFDFDSHDGTEQFEKIFNALSQNCQLNGDIDLTIIPPGQGTLSILLNNYIHGIIGHFPDVCYLEETLVGKSRAYLPKTTFDGRGYRIAGRDYRKSLFKANKNKIK